MVGRGPCRGGAGGGALRGACTPSGCSGGRRCRRAAGWTGAVGGRPTSSETETPDRSQAGAWQGRRRASDACRH